MQSYNVNILLKDLNLSEAVSGAYVPLLYWVCPVHNLVL